MKSRPFTFMAAMCLSAVPMVGIAAELVEVASFDKQLTGIAVSPRSGRIFVNFPFWSADHQLSVAEVGLDGKPALFPNEKWNAKEGDAKHRFVCVQSVVIDDEDNLWILDAGSPMQEGVIPGGAKLVKADLKTNEVIKSYPVGELAAPKKSYLNDVRIDTKSGHAFITESGIGSLIVINLKNGETRRFLANHPSTKVEIGKELIVDGIKPIDPTTQGTPQFNADGIALDAKSGTLYFHALTGQTLYKVSTRALTDPNTTDKEVEDKVEKVAKTASPDGMLEDKAGNVYLAAFEKNAIIRFDTDSQKSTTVVEDKKLQWPDTMSWGPEDTLYVTTSQIHRTPKYNHGESKLEEPYHIYKIKVEKQ